jgi:uncharacterized protein (DUF3084 family)
VLLLLAIVSVRAQDIPAAREKLTQALSLLDDLSQSLAQREEDLTLKDALSKENEADLKRREDSLRATELALSGREQGIAERESLTQERESAYEAMGLALRELESLYARQSRSLTLAKYGLVALGVAAIVEGITIIVR